MRNSSQLIGGPNCVVEIGKHDSIFHSCTFKPLLDESMFGKRKYNRGRLKNQLWILGGVCRQHSKNNEALIDFMSN